MPIADLNHKMIDDLLDEKVEHIFSEVEIDLTSFLDHVVAGEYV